MLVNPQTFYHWTLLPLRLHHIHSTKCSNILLCLLIVQELLAVLPSFLLTLTTQWLSGFFFPLAKPSLHMSFSLAPCHLCAGRKRRGSGRSCCVIMLFMRTSLLTQKKKKKHTFLPSKLGRFQPMTLFWANSPIHYMAGDQRKRIPQPQDLIWYNCPKPLNFIPDLYIHWH